MLIMFHDYHPWNACNLFLNGCRLQPKPDRVIMPRTQYVEVYFHTKLTFYR